MEDISYILDWEIQSSETELIINYCLDQIMTPYNLLFSLNLI